VCVIVTHICEEPLVRLSPSIIRGDAAHGYSGGYCFLCQCTHDAPTFDEDLFIAGFGSSDMVRVPKAAHFASTIEFKSAQVWVLCLCGDITCTCVVDRCGGGREAARIKLTTGTWALFVNTCMSGFQLQVLCARIFPRRTTSDLQMRGHSIVGRGVNMSRITR
jgi:hypothetical protein